MHPLVVRAPWFELGGQGVAPDSRLQAGVGEVVWIRQFGARQRYGLSVALGGQAVEHRPPRVPQSEKSRHLVERFARRVVAGLAEATEPTLGVEQMEHGVAARNNQRQQRITDLRAAFQVRHQGRMYVGFQMIDADVGHAERARQAAPVAPPGKQSADQPGTRLRSPESGSV